MWLWWWRDRLPPKSLIRRTTIRPHHFRLVEQREHSERSARMRAHLAKIFTIQQNPKTNLQVPTITCTNYRSHRAGDTAIRVHKSADRRDDSRPLLHDTVGLNTPSCISTRGINAQEDINQVEKSREEDTVPGDWRNWPSLAEHQEELL